MLIYENTDADIAEKSTLHWNRVVRLPAFQHCEYMPRLIKRPQEAISKQESREL